MRKRDLVGITLVFMILSTFFIIGGRIANAYLDDKEAMQLLYTNGGALPDFNPDQNTDYRLGAALVRLEYKNQGFFCTGTVISDDYVLTAAHCLMDHEGLFKLPVISKRPIMVISMKDPKGNYLKVEGRAAAVNNRADYALIKGNFKDFTHVNLMWHADSVMQVSPHLVTCGFPYGAEPVCYPINPAGLSPYYDGFFAQGASIYAGMSGGPVIDLQNHAIFAVNSAVLPGGILISPLIGIFASLGIEVTE